MARLQSSCSSAALRLSDMHVQIAHVQNGNKTQQSPCRTSNTISQAAKCLESANALQGLAFPAISNLQTTPAFFNMLNDGSLDAPLFSLYMNPDPSKDPAGSLSFGVIDPSKYTGKISYAPVTTKKCASCPAPLILRYLASLSVDAFF